MKYKELIVTINKKKENSEEYYEYLLLLEKEIKLCEPFVRPQILYILGVDYVVYGDSPKALDFQYAAFQQIINLIYTDSRETGVLSSIIQKVIIEISKILRPSKPSGVIKMFYQKSPLPEDHRLKKAIRDFQDVKRVLPGTNEVFMYLLQTNLKECLFYIEEESQVDLLAEKLKYKFDPELLEDLRRLKRTDKLLVILLIYDIKHFEDHLKDMRHRIITDQTHTKESSMKLMVFFITSCLSTSHVETLKKCLREFICLFPESDKKKFTVFYSDIYKVFSEEIELDDLIDLEQVVYYWFITGQYSKIIKIRKRVSKKVLFICQSRISKEKFGEEDGEEDGDEDGEEDGEEYKDEYKEKFKNDDGDEDFDKIGYTWEIENDLIKEKCKLFLRKGNFEKIKSIIRSVRDINLLIDLLNVLRERKEYVIILGVIRDILKTEGLFFQGVKVFISFLHLKELAVEISERLAFLGAIDYKRLSKGDQEWIYKVLYNNLVDVYEERVPIEVDHYLEMLLDLSLIPESFMISILLISKSKLDALYSSFSSSPSFSSYTVLILFYEKFLEMNPSKARDVFEEINLREVDDSSLLYLLGLREVEGGVVLESHFRKILTPSHFEEIVIRLSLKGTLFLYEYLQSLVLIEIKGYLTEECRGVLKTSLKIVEHLKCSEMILFFQGVLL